MSDSVRLQRRRPTRLPCPWDSPGKNTGVGCCFLLQCMKVKSESEVAQSCPTLATPWTAAYQAPPSMGFARQEYWSGVPLPSPKSPMGSHLTGTHIVGCMSNRLLARSHILYVSLPHVLLRLNLSNKSFKRIYVEKVLKPQEK